jgi:glycosyltransferase involved in cell wall biosynthesis
MMPGPVTDEACFGPRITMLATQAGRAGGAAIAMERLATAVRAAGGRVDVVTRAEMPPVPAVAQRLERIVRRGIRRARTPVSNTLFTADWPAWNLTDHPAVAAADLVNVHWVAGFIAAAGIRQLVESGRPVAWTLHDMRPFTGGCHYGGGCAGFTAACTACPQLAADFGLLPERSLARARRRLAGVPLTFVSPSRWLAGELVRSSLFDPQAHQVRVIPNGIDLVRYSSGDRRAVRQRLGLPEAGLAILLGSVSLDERRKGAGIAAEAVARAAAEIARRGAAPPPVAVTYGSGTVEIPGVTCRHLGSLDEAGVLDALQACDLHLTMAREDNLPNTVIEAFACGLPVVATRAGGHPEMITDGASGWLVGVDDAPAAAAVLVRLAENPTLVRAAAVRGRATAEAQWDARLQARRYLELAAELGGTPPLKRRPENHRSEWTAAPVMTPDRVTPAAVSVVHRGGPLRGPLRRLRRLAGLARKSAPH